MLAGKVGTAQTENGFDLRGRCVLGEQLSGQPQIDDAPIGLWKAFANVPTRQPALIDGDSSLRGDGRRSGNVGSVVSRHCRRRGRYRWQRLNDSLQQVVSAAGQNCAGLQNFYPRSVTGSPTARQLLIGKARQSSQVTLVRAGQISLVGVGQLLSDSSCQGRWQGCSAEVNPGLQMTGAGLDHHAGFMSIGPHASHNLGRRAIEIEQDIAAVVLLGVRHDIYVISLAVALTEKAHHRSMHQLTCRPKSLSWTRPLCTVVNQTDQEQIMRHGRELTADSSQCQKKSTIQHVGENATEAPCCYNEFSANGNNPLNSVSQPRGAVQSAGVSRKWNENFPLSPATRNVQAWGLDGTRALNFGKTGGGECGKGCG